MEVYKGKVRKSIFLICISLFLGVIIAFVHAGFRSLQAGEDKGKHQIDNTSIKKDCKIKISDGRYSVSTEGGKLTIVLPKKTYINKLSYEYSSDFFSGCVLDIKKENIYGELETLHIQDKIMKDMPRSVVNIGGVVSRIEIFFEESENNFEVWNFEIDNSLKTNPLIAVFFSTIIFLFGFLVAFKKENSQMPAFAALVTIIVSSICLLLAEPPYIVGRDEQIHYNNAYMMGVSKKGETLTQVEEYMYSFPFAINTFSEPAQESIEERLDFIKIFNNKKKNPGVLIDDYEWNLTSIGYIFQACALKLGNVFQVPFYMSWLLGKFSNVLLYAIIMCIAIYIVPIGKRILMVFAMMPTMIFQSTVYTYDITVIAFIILATCVLIREFVSPNKIFRYRWRVLFIACFILGCLPKAVYAPIILGGILIEKDKYYSDKDRKCFKGFIIVVFVALMMSFILPTLISPEQIGDARGGNTDGVGQMQYVIGQPICYAIVLIKNVLNSLENYLLGIVLCHFSYLGIGKLATTASILMVGVVLTDKFYDDVATRSALTIKMKIGMLFLVAMVIALIWTALYLDFTEVGKSVISGVQSRYYLPFLFIIYICFCTEKIYNCFTRETYQLAIMLISCGLLYQQIWQLILVEKCM